jgi:hypothetical protein
VVSERFQWPNCEEGEEDTEQAVSQAEVKHRFKAVGLLLVYYWLNQSHRQSALSLSTLNVNNSRASSLPSFPTDLFDFSCIALPIALIFRSNDGCCSVGQAYMTLDVVREGILRSKKDELT